MQFEFVDSIDTIDKDRWNALCQQDYPFLRYEFIAALEHSGCTNHRSGWQPHHLLIRNKLPGSTGRDDLIGIMPLYMKTHSYGEYVFDWAWADAYHRHGVPYYPKLVTAIPFTPATGPRLLLDPSILPETIVADLVEAIQQEVAGLQASSWHCLFPSEELSALLQRQRITRRTGYQYHWLNQGYGDFQEFLSTFTSRKRKNVNRERRVVREQGIKIQWKQGTEINEEDWQRFYQFYHLTYFKRSGRQGYLNQDFFLRLGQSMPDQLAMVNAVEEASGIVVAAALFFHDSHTLYGRYWGCSEEVEFLHFEACYYQGIEFAIQHRLQRFDPGAQGEHKIQRGFTPLATYSNHWIAQSDFRRAIVTYLAEENAHNLRYLEHAKEYLPFKCE